METKSKIPSLVIGDLTAKVPIVQGGMGVGISLAGLASAVARAGGIGVLSTVGAGLHEKDILKNYKEANARAAAAEIRKAKSMAEGGIIGVNIMCVQTDYDELAQAAINENVDIIFSGAGLPLQLPSFLKPESTTKLVPIISSAKAGEILIKKWKLKYDYIPDAVVVEGPLAGGHLGFKPEQIDDPAFALENLVPEILEMLKKYEELYGKKIPLIAAGGIYTGQDIKKIIQLGAAGVQMATRFVTTDECDATMEFKQAYLDSKKDDILIIKSPVGLPGRAIKNQFLTEVESGLKKPVNCPYHCIKTCDSTKTPYCIALALLNAKKGNIQNGFAFAGANAYKTDKIIPVQELVDILVKEYESAAK
jgi:nitronate monooxygenase